MTDSEYNIFRNGLECIVSGYNNLRPCAYFYRRNHIDSITGEGFISNNLLENAHIRQIGGLKNITNIDIVSMVKLIKQFINIEANSYKNGISPIGGPPSVAYITKEGKIYEDFQKGNSYKTVLEAMTAAFNDKSHRIYRSPQDSVIYKNSIKHFYLH